MSDQGACQQGRRTAALWRARLGPLDGTAGWGALPEWLLRAGLAFVFAYAALSAFIAPSTLERYLPGALPATWSKPLSWVFAGYELGLVIALLTRRYLFAASMLSAATLAAIIVVNPSAFGVLFRNVAIICAALALALSDGTPRPSAGRAAPPRHRHRTSARARARARQQGDVDSCCSAVG